MSFGIEGLDACKMHRFFAHWERRYFISMGVFDSPNAATQGLAKLSNFKKHSCRTDMHRATAGHREMTPDTRSLNTRMQSPRILLKLYRLPKSTAHAKTGRNFTRKVSIISRKIHFSSKSWCACIQSQWCASKGASNAASGESAATACCCGPRERKKRRSAQTPTKSSLVASGRGSHTRA